MSWMWPGITPFNVWDLPYDMWQMYATAAAEIEEKQAQGGRSGVQVPELPPVR